MLALNLSTAVYVTAYEYGPEETDPETGLVFAPVIGVQPGARLDVQRECLDAHPLLAWGCVNPAVILHDCGPNGIRLYAETLEHIQAAAPVTGSRWDVFVTEPVID